MANLDTKHRLTGTDPGPATGPGGFSTITVKPRGRIPAGDPCLSFLTSEGFTLDIEVVWIGSSVPEDSVNMQVLIDGTLIDPSQYGTYFIDTSPFVLPPTSVPFIYPNELTPVPLNVYPDYVNSTFTFTITADGDLSDSCCVDIIN